MPTRQPLLLLCLGASVLVPGRGTLAQVDARLIRQPDVSQSHIAFAYAGDIWITDKVGGPAHRLTTAEGSESFPRFSPDGSKIAFTGNYDGNLDLYVMPVLGGVPLRVTYHPSTDRLLDWSPDGSSLLFASGRESPLRFNELFIVSWRGGLPTKLPVPHGEVGTLAPSGRTILLTPSDWSFSTWKRYRGGLAPDIWSFDLETLEAVNLTDDPANDSQPMWHAGTMYFLSDRGASARNNIWARDAASGELRQVTRFEEFDVHFPSIGPSELVFEAGGTLYLMDLNTEQTREVSLEVVTDSRTLRPRHVLVEDLIQEARISPSGKRVIFEARGELFSVPAEHGPVLNLTASSGVAERSPSWSPDGTHIAYWSDEPGEYELTIRPAHGRGPPERLTGLGAGFRYALQWSPDSRALAFMDETGTIRIFNRDDGSLRIVAVDPWRAHPEKADFVPSWSPDSRWLAFDLTVENRNHAIFLHDRLNDVTTRVTSGVYSDYNPVFDPDGKYLFFLSNRALQTISGDFLEFDFVQPNSTRFIAVPLRVGQRSPVSPRDDREASALDSLPGHVPDAVGEEDEGEEREAEELRIDIAGLERRMVVLPAEPGRFRQLAAAPGKLISLRLPVAGASGETSLVYWDIEARREETVLEGVDYFDLTGDGGQALVYRGGAFGIVDVKPGQPVPRSLRTSELRMSLEPAEEWRQLFSDAWRFQRDFFYDAGMHGVDWARIRDVYGGLLEHAVTRSDVSYVIGEMIGELNSSHTYRVGGDLETGPSESVGLLGVDWEIADGAYRIRRIIQPPAWEAEARSPLSEPGVNIRSGDYILAVNGVPFDTSREPWASFQGLGGETVTLTVNSVPRGDGARSVTVELLSSDSRLRYLAWVEQNRTRVSEATDGGVGYVHVPNTAELGHNELVRSYVAQSHLDALIIDERFNSGGWLPDRLVEVLGRSPLNFQARRHGPDEVWPYRANGGPRVMLINGWSGSGGDAFPEYFRKRGLGPIVGTRTWGGRIGLTGSPDLIDGGVVSVPTYRNYDPGGGWFAEGHGVEPDIVVQEDLSALARGVDVQLERAVEEALRLLARVPAPKPARPPTEQRVPPAR